MVCAYVREDNPLAKACGLSSRTYAQTIYNNLHLFISSPKLIPCLDRIEPGNCYTDIIYIEVAESCVDLRLLQNSGLSINAESTLDQC